MTKRGFFIINGVPRVIISQVIRSPGIYFQQRILKTIKNSQNKSYRTFYADLISQRGTWLRIEIDKYKKIWIYMKKTSRIPFFVLLRTLGFNIKSIFRLILYSNSILENYAEFFSNKSQFLRKSDIYVKKFLNPNSYSLGTFGRLQLNQKLGLSTPLNKLTLTPNDWFSCIEGLIDVTENKRNLDDIDNLQNRRVKTAGEFMSNQLNQGLLQLEQNIFEKAKKLKKNLSLKTLINGSFINNSFKDFFASSQLSQYLDQTNPLAELTHKRRLSSIGPGGINRETAGMVVRSIHPTHYGRICPIETPEGKNAGLVNSITVFGDFNKTGLIETPYYLVYKGQVQKKMKPFFIDSKIERKYQILLNSIKRSSLNFLPKIPFPIRSEQNFHTLYRKNVNFSIISCFQLISLATSLIPFLEHDDANRALMGSNMQRQAVPLLKNQRPCVGTGLENVVIYDSNYNLYSKKGGVLLYSTNTVVILYQFLKKNSNKENCNPFKVFENLKVLNSSKIFFNYNSQKLKKIQTLYSNQNKRKFGFQNINLEIQKGKAKIYLYLNSKADWKVPIKINQIFKLIKKSNYLNLINSISSTTLYNLKEIVLFKAAFKKANLSLNYYLTNKQKNSFCLFQTQSSNLDLYKFSYWKQYFIITDLYTFNKKNFKAYRYTQKYFLKTYNRTNQGTCLTQKPFFRFHNWVEKGELLTNTSFSDYGELSLGQNLLVGYLPWEGYNFEDAVLINEKLVYKDTFTSLHIEKYEIQTRETPFGFEYITSQIPQITRSEFLKLDKRGIIKLGSRVQEGDILVGRITPIRPRKLLPHEKLIYDIIGKESSSIKDTSLRVQKGIEGQVVDIQISKVYSIMIPKTNNIQPIKVTISILEQRKIKVGDKIAGRHGNKGIISKVLSRQNMPYLPNGTQLDMILNPLGVPSRMNVGQIFESLLGFSGNHLNKIFKVLPFDESYGHEFSRTVVYFNLYRAQQKLNQKWIFSPKNLGKVRVFDGRTGQCLKFPVMVGLAYMMKLIHLVDEKIHARSTGAYSLVTQQPLRGRSKHGGQRFGEMEVWALEGFGAAYILQELLTVKSDDIKGRQQIIESILNDSNINFGTPESFKVLVREIQALCLDIRVQTQKIYIENN